MTMWDAGACAVALAGASLLVNPMLLAKNGEFLGMFILYMLEGIRLQRIVLCE